MNDATSLMVDRGQVRETKTGSDRENGRCSDRCRNKETEITNIQRQCAKEMQGDRKIQGQMEQARERQVE